MSYLTLQVEIPSAEAMRALASEWVQRWGAGDIVLLNGELGAGKTTFVRGALEGLGFHDAVRSPTFNLIQTFATDPPVMHADLYRVEKATGIGLEEYFETHLCFIEWPDRLGSLLPEKSCWRLNIDFAGEGRKVTVRSPEGTS